jgi:hypothetical protein
MGVWIRRAAFSFWGRDLSPKGPQKGRLDGSYVLP